MRPCLARHLVAARGDAAGRALLRGGWPLVGGQQPASRLVEDDASSMVAMGARAHHSPLPKLQTTVPAWVRSGLSRPSRALRGQDQRSTMIEGLSAITLATHDMRRALSAFIRRLGLRSCTVARYTTFSGKRLTGA